MLKKLTGTFLPPIFEVPTMAEITTNPMKLVVRFLQDRILLMRFYMLWKTTPLTKTIFFF